MRRAALIAVAVAWAGCDHYIEPLKSSETNNATAQVAELFTHDGCTVYRFVDRGWDHYYVRCSVGEDAQTATDLDQAKPSIHLHENIRTVPSVPRSVLRQSGAPGAP